VIDADQKLLGVVSLRDLFTAARPRRCATSAPATWWWRREHGPGRLSRLFAEHDLQAIPVVDAEGRMKGIVTVDDIVDVIQEEATEDIQKIGGTAALEAPYLETGFGEPAPQAGGMARGAVRGRDADRRARWDDSRTRSRGGGADRVHPAHHLERRQRRLAGVDAGDSRDGAGRGEARRLVAGGAARSVPGRRDGALLAAIGFLRVELWEWVFHSYGSHSMLVGITVGASVLGVVTFGTVAGRAAADPPRVGLDPASASAPFVATFVDVTGIIIYFSVASLVLRGTLL
jgi:magnesium transporter